MRRHRFGASKHPAELDFDLNLAPIIDCLTVLITFTLVSASFLSVAVFDAGAAPNSSAETKTPPVSVAVQITQAGEFEINVTGELTRTSRIPASAKGAMDLPGLSKELKELRAQWPMVEGVSLSAQGRVDYKTVVKAMETVRESFPSVVLGGF